MTIEQWRAIPGWPYEVSNIGRVRRADTHKIKTASTLKPSGYKIVHLYSGGESKSFLVHRLVCCGFNGEPPSPDHQVAHNDGVKTNNHADNLRWATSKENHADRVVHGSHTRGERCGTHKLTAEQVAEVRRRYVVAMAPALAEGKTRTPYGWLSGVARELGVTHSCISDVLPHGRSWKHVA
jgi:hypothetical protein